jgi:hypothetical protein
MTNGKTVIKSIRVDFSLEKRLAEASKKRNITESAYVSGALRRELMVEPLLPAFEGITIERSTFCSILALANRAAVDILGTEVARRNIPLELDSVEPQLRRQLLFAFLADVAADCWHWFKIGLSQEGEARILLYHQFGINWSLFLKSFLLEGFAMVSNTPPRISVTENLIKVDWTINERLGDLQTSPRTQRESLIIG